ncbi:hypothetical protein BGZ65_012489, partial [Modicella reniformis]
KDSVDENTVDQRSLKTLPVAVKRPPVWRPFPETVLSALNEVSTSKSDQDKALYHEDKLGRMPIAISIDGTEQNALVAREVYDALPDGTCLAVLHKPVRDPKVKQPWETLPALHPLEPSIEEVVEETLAPVIGTRKFQELSKENFHNLNLDWTRSPQAPLVAGHLLSGAILLDVSRRSAILINEVKVYGRTRSTDCHLEQKGLVKGVPKDTSTPSTLGKDYYKDVHPMTSSSTTDGKRLISYLWRAMAGRKAAVSVGGNTLNYVINEHDSPNVRIFLDSEREKQAREMAKKSADEVLEKL